MPTAHDPLRFCPFCFATDEDGSWHHTVAATHCSNCGVIDSSVTLPRWAVESIRQQASWVGKRYYPNAEDQQLATERRALLAQVQQFPGRTARPTPSQVYGWVVAQALPDGVTEEIMVTAVDAAAALEAARYALTYVPQEHLNG
jgi:hypothetical protein